MSHKLPVWERKTCVISPMTKWHNKLCIIPHSNIFFLLLTQRLYSSCVWWTDPHSLCCQDFSLSLSLFYRSSGWINRHPLCFLWCDIISAFCFLPYSNFTIYIYSTYTSVASLLSMPACLCKQSAHLYSESWGSNWICTAYTQGQDGRLLCC